jgi:hypothetical protein
MLLQLQGACKSKLRPWLADPLNMHTLYSIGHRSCQWNMPSQLVANTNSEPLEDAQSSLECSLHLLALVAFARTSTGSGADHRHGLFTTL